MSETGQKVGLENERGLINDLKIKRHEDLLLQLMFLDNLVDTIRASYGAETSSEYDERFLDFVSFTPSSIPMLGIREASVEIQQSVKEFAELTHTPFVDSLQPIGDCAEVMKVEHIDHRKRPYVTYSYWSPSMERHGRNTGKSDDIWALQISLLGMMRKLAYRRNQKAPKKEIEALQAAFVEIYKIYARRSASALDFLV
ncbi:serine threonine kinase [Fusarium mundagurra]|uniref:Serine threonine kinase n=1 Tax=Fusarium mundagurra TaxID=1567541 RepID=A0A8H6D7B7_9HYPO|nr:serine threonine kinase [Fusarium mundagurra]